ncbi:hypothetical protein SG34_020450 [Thalassomonas viridans]|uniref:Autotransporter domain-containing protein n=1 Tax=Thalassomonas viridans TaxID=137584 RepID=A0AAF0C7I3_9GAMM|nr:hypothetical protein [Thalassomonas viridans]WDE03733.1 hypothetical protein SG34_020450 [Thalassomonas viridans]
MKKIEKNSPNLLLPLTLLLGSSLVSVNSFADSLDLAYGELEQHVELQNQTLLLKPSGLSLYFSHDLNPDWNISVFYQSMSDDKNADNQLDVELDLNTYGGNVNYYRDKWYFSAGLSVADDEQNIRSGTIRSAGSDEDTSAVSVSTSLGYGDSQGNWLYDLSLGLQYSDWEIDTRNTLPANNPPPGENPPPGGNVQVMESTTSDNSLSVNTSVSLGHYWSLADNRGVLAGAMLSWSYIVSGDAVSDSQASGGSRLGGEGGRNPGGRSRGSRTGGATSLFATSGDDNYGQLLMYVSYDINSSWSLSLDTAREIASDYSEQSWSLNLGYVF